MLLVRTTRFSRGRLPHWEIEHERYFVTVRCGDSLPAEAIARLAAVNLALQQIPTRSPAFGQLQRQYFLTLEKYLDRGLGACPLRDPRAAAALVECFETLVKNGARVAHFTIMPNHWHALIEPIDGAALDLRKTMSHLKGASSRAINQRLGRRGPIWQREWFDRWMRSDAEWEKCRDYIRQNPVKAGFVHTWTEHPWTR